MKKIIDRLEEKMILPKEEILRLLTTEDEDSVEYLFERARAIKEENYGKKIYIRGLIEFTNYCKNDCYYCGIRRSNTKAQRYRLTEEEILLCCQKGYKLGFRTFVLQGGEDLFWTDEKLCRIVERIHRSFPDCAITLSIGERAFESYKKLYEAGADRYLLRHETSCEQHYGRLHPKNLSLKNRMSCLKSLKRIGFQTGCGFMVGSPFQTLENICEDLIFIKEFSPEMVGIGPFIPHKDTPFGNYKKGSAGLTLKSLAITRLMLPKVLLPSTTALGTALEDGRMRGVLAGANVIMPNLSPKEVRKKYLLYDDKIATGDEAAESIESLKKSMEKIGYCIVTDRGDYLK
ncbi:MAG: [FeFe] hydrogenase H-cluster radical SAM maturase HydE [Eubacteriales bacterium]|nr:[FeFe] hydrogenase H-cluster radical SAM maturase HydE [Eubacteriales bacterium]